MNNRPIRFVLLATLLVAISVPAVAQIEEIVVTAEKREESLQDVSISVTAFNEELLKLGGIDDVSRLELLVPGLNYAFAGNDAKFNVRGANSTNTFGDNSSIVGAFVDGVYKARASQQTRAFFDVKAIEFLRGPQGTLYGRNTFAGALNVYTHIPDTQELSGEIGISHQAFDRQRGDGYFNLPISDNFAVRAAGFFDKSDGYIDNVAGPDVGAQDDKGFRLSALWNPSDRADVIVRYTRVAEDGNEAGLFGYTFNCRFETVDGLTDAFGSERNCTNPVRGSSGLGTASNGPGGNPWTISQDYIRPVDLEDEEVSLQVIYDFDSFTLKSITSVNDFTNDINFDFDFGPTPNQHGGYLEESEGWSQEFALLSNNESSFQWTAGFYYSDLEDFSSFYIYDKTVREDTATIRPTVTVDINGVPTDFTVLTATGIVSDETLLNNFFANAVQIDTEYFGVFGQAEFSVNDQLRLIGGLRYNDEEKKASCGGSNFTGDTNMDGTVDRVVNILPGVEGSSPFILPDSAIDVFSINCGASDAVTSAMTTMASSSFGEFDNVTWRAGVEYDFNDEIMLYVTGSTGYLSGSASTQTTTDEQESQVIEVGFRGVLLDNTLQFNGAVHYTEYTNLLTQRQEIDPNTGIVLTFSDNGGDIDAFGVELDAVWVPNDQLTLSGTLAYLDSEFGTFGQTNPYQLYRGEVSPFVDQSGETTPWSPELTFSGSAGYRYDLGDNGWFTPYLQTYYSDGYNTSNLLATDPAHDQDSYTKTDVRLIWDSPDETYSIEAFVENIEDSDVLARGNNNSDDVVQTSYLYPRNYGVKFRARFY
ncbi:MAG: TonB-dependent receptor [Gammaproteobacteria bacterium]|nr:TonB-dependent receptor [Gammaproteobacteria bacterium]